MKQSMLKTIYQKLKFLDPVAKWLTKNPFKPLIAVVVLWVLIKFNHWIYVLSNFQDLLFFNKPF